MSPGPPSHSIAERGTGLPPLSPHPFLRYRQPASASLRIVSLDEAEQLLAQSEGQRRFAPIVFGFSPECCSASLRNSVRLRLRIPMMSISHSDLMPIRSERSDAELS